MIIDNLTLVAIVTVVAIIAFVLGSRIRSDPTKK